MSETGRGFGRSSRFGIVGVVVVAVLAAAIALVFGQGGGDPTGVVAVILGLVFGFVAVLMYLQRRDLDAAEARSMREARGEARPVTDPTTADRISLLTDLAVAPLDRELLAAATGRSWALARGSMGAGPPLMVLIFLAVVPWQLFGFVWSLVVFVPIIAGYAIYLSVRTLMPGGALDRAHEDQAPMLAALGLTESDRPRVSIRHTPIGPRAVSHEIEGAVAYGGQRNGREVRVRIEGGSEVVLAAAVDPFEVRAKGERLRAADGAPAAVGELLAGLRASSYWKGVAATGDADGVRVKRRSKGGEHWMRDLWLAEHLADAATGSG